MKSYSFRRRYKQENTPEEKAENKVSKTLVIETKTKTILSTESPKKTVSDEAKEKYKFRKKERKGNSSSKKENNVKNKLKEEKNKKNKDENAKKIKFKEDINDIERVCTSKTLKKDLVELYQKVLENNSEFKENIFFKNLLDTEKKIGKMDDLNEKQISHTFKEAKTKDILRNIESENSLIRKYTLRAKRIYDDD
jgi:hypothetical protein